ncbi:MAG: transferrin-binding protein-like solute binding protein [Novosphingobium sp.]|nr:transferrin-binding protein-like solute binding protein [Novosphingobium sp.]
MGTGRFAAGASLLPLGLLLAACGGGGVNSTPTPTPTPGTPTPSPGTPTPTPTPIPTGLNDNLLAPLVSESFTNVSSRAKASYGPEGQTGGSASSTTATISYNAGNQSYTLSTPTGSITFGPGDIDNSQSNSAALVYVKETDDQVDSLTLTRPGTSGPVTYKYVGAAFWQRIVQVSPTRVDGSIDSIVYGVETTQANRQVSGSANYAIDLIGATTSGASDLVAISGGGTASVDFSTGRIMFVGTLDLSTSASFFGDAKIASSAPTFSGTLVLNDGQPFEMALKGQFFGPDSAEIGAVFSGQSPDERLITGAILGRKGAADKPNPKFNGEGNNQLTNSQTFAASEASVSVTTGSGGNVTGSTKVDPIAIRFDAETKTYVIAGQDYTMQANDGGSMFVYGARDSGTWDDRTTGLDLDYVRVRLNQDQGGPSGTDRYGFQLYGMPTLNSAIPRSGSAGYGIRLDGIVADSVTDKKWLMNGYGDFFVNLGTGKVTAYVPAAYYNLSGAGAPGAGDWNLSGTLASSSNNFSGTVTFNGVGDYTGTLNGQFFGPAAQEVGGLFTATGPSGSAASGAIFGAKDPNVDDPAGTMPGLKDLTSSTDLQIYSADLNYFYQESINSISYNPGTGNYVLKLDHQDLNLDSTTFQAAKSNGNIRVYEGEGDADGSSWIATVPNLGSASSSVAYTYTMFVDARYNGNDPVRPHLREYMVAAAGIDADRIPLGGSATYSGLTQGYAYYLDNATYANSGIFKLSGTASFNVNFTNDSLSATFSDFAGERIAGLGSETVSATNQSFAGFSVNGSLMEGNYDFFGSATQDGWFRSYSGGFFGPNAAEIGGTFTAVHGTEADPQYTEIAGAFIGKKN